MPLISGKTIYGGPITYTWENANSFGEFCYNRIKRHGDKVLLVSIINNWSQVNDANFFKINKWLKIDGITGEKITASQILHKSIRVAECLQHYGIKAGDCVGINSENRFEIPYVMFAVFFIGATYTPFNPTYSERMLNHFLLTLSSNPLSLRRRTLSRLQPIFAKNYFCFSRYTW